MSDNDVAVPAAFGPMQAAEARRPMSISREVLASSVS